MKRKNLPLPVRQTPASIAEVMARTEVPTTKCYWTRKPGKIINKFTGKHCPELENSKEIQVLEWYQTLLTRITDVSNIIHRKSLRGPGNFIVVNRDARTILECLVTYKPFLKGDTLPNADFEDATPIATLNNRFTVLLSDSLLENKIMVGLLGEGFEYRYGKTPKEDEIPIIDLVITQNPRLFKGEVSYWGFVELLDITYEF